MTNIVIITGNQHEGKTSFLRKVVQSLNNLSITVGGFIAEPIFNGDQRTGYDLIDLKTGNKIKFCTTEINENWQKTGCYFFNPQGLNTGSQWLDDANKQDSDVNVIDEVGPLELKGFGWDAVIANLLITVTNPMIWVVRESIIKEVISKYNLQDTSIFHIRNSDISDVTNAIQSNLMKKIS
jgi:nucleoside-triphosphatase